VNRAAIFDMDGILINSEPLWWPAVVEALRTVDVPPDADASLRRDIFMLRC
jgi:beta-phosphoglucomutase-like phosphatase (HAD superfamily)